MLNAALAGKKRGTGMQSQQTALQEAEGAEDVLTASVFERMAYFPDELLSAVLSELLGMPFGVLQSIEFWPSWYLADKARIEPDLLLHDGQQSLIVEAKRYDNRRQQDPKQLANELLAGWNGAHLSCHSLLLTLGGLEDTTESRRQSLLSDVLKLLPLGSESRFTLICRNWQQLYQALENHIGPNATAGCQRLLEDIAQCYSWHSLKTHPMRWLNDLGPLGLNSHPNALTTWSMK